MNAVVRDLCASVSDLSGPPTGREQLEATARPVGLALILGAGASAYWRLPLGIPAVAVLLGAGVACALLLIATHEMVHGTLLGSPGLEAILGCVLGWSMAWPFLTYSRLHQLHHRWNSRDPRDPGRTEGLASEPQDPRWWRTSRHRRGWCCCAAWCWALSV